MSSTSGVNRTGSTANASTATPASGGGADYGNYTTYHFDDVDEMSDYESTGAPPPPPPEGDLPASMTQLKQDGTTTTTPVVDGVPKDLEANNNKLNETLATDPDYGDLANANNANDDDFDEEDGSVEIPPTKVVQDMERRETAALSKNDVLCARLDLQFRNIQNREAASAGFDEGLFDVFQQQHQSAAGAISWLSISVKSM